MGNKSASVGSGAGVDAMIAARAARQHGLVTHAQLRAVGLSRSAISKWANGGRLHRVHRGVYAVGHSHFDNHRRWMAAVLACGDGAVLSHASAAALWGLIRPLDEPIDVSVPTGNGRRRRAEMRIHRRARLGRASFGSQRPMPPALTVRDFIPVTAPWLTIDDLRTVVSPQLHRRAIRQAEMRRFVLLPASPRDRTRSDPERSFLALCRAHRLPEPQVNVRVGRWTVDFLWARAEVVVEIDTWGTHGGSVAFEDDHERDLDLRRRGLAVHRYTDVQLEQAPASVIADLGVALGVAPEPARP